MRIASFTSLIHSSPCWHNPQDRAPSPLRDNQKKNGGTLNSPNKNLMYIKTEIMDTNCVVKWTPPSKSNIYLSPTHLPTPTHGWYNPNNHDLIYVISNNCFSFTLSIAQTTTKRLTIWKIKKKKKVTKISFEFREMSLNVDNQKCPVCLFMKNSWKLQRYSVIGFPNSHNIFKQFANDFQTKR